MENDCCVHVRKCHKCQTFADNVNALPVPLNVLATPWSFSMWGTDVIGAIEPKDPSCTSNNIWSASFTFTHHNNTISWFLLYKTLTETTVIQFKRKKIINTKQIFTNKSNNNK